MDEQEIQVVEPVTDTTEIDALAAKDAVIAKVTEDRDNYKNVAMKRLGKLPGDAEFLSGEDKPSLSVEDQVRIALLDNEIAKAHADKDREIARMAKELSEVKLALKNRPGGSMGSGSGASTNVKDNVFSEAQLTALKQRAEVLKIDPETYIASAKKNLSQNPL